MRHRTAPILAGLLALAACSDEAGNFSQHPGFAEWYAAHPPDRALPTPAERALLERYQPRVTRGRSTSTATTSPRACSMRPTAR